MKRRYAVSLTIVHKDTDFLLNRVGFNDLYVDKVKLELLEKPENHKFYE